MVKSEFVNLLAEKLPQHNQREIDTMTNFILRTMVNSLKKGERIEIRGFGSLNIKELDPRIAINPKTREKVKTSGRLKVIYRCSKLLKKLVNDLPSED